MSRQLDAAIAGALGYKVKIEKYSFGEYHVATNKTWDGYCPSCGYDGLWSEREVPDYSTDGNAMLELDREMRARGYKHHIHSVSGYRGDEKVEELEVVFYKNHNEQVTAWRSEKEMPMIFAKQAYKALTGKEWCE